MQNEVLQKLYAVNKLLVLVGRVAEELEELFGKPVSWGIFILLLVSILAMVFYTRPVNAASSGIVYIRADGSIDPSTAPISSVDNITYLFTGDISYPTYNGIVIQRNDISIDGNDFTMKGFNQTGMGLNLTNIRNVTIKNTNIENFLVGIYLSGSNNSLVDNSIMNNTNGIHLYSSSYNTVTKNNITMNSVSGILLEYSYNNNVISQNLFLGDGLTVWASWDNSIVDNLVNGKPLVYLEGISNYSVNGDVGQVVLVDCNQTTVENLTISGTTFGIDLWNTANSSISGCTIANSVYGITLDESSLNTISGNSIMTNHYHGIFLYSSTNNTIVGNDLAANGYDGIVLMDGSSFNVVSGNNITESGDYGVFLSSANNLFYHNNFVNNNVQDLSTGGSLSIWDNGYPSGGNYWSDYNGTDIFRGTYQNVSGSDGIGDEAYSINAYDRYPLMAPFSDFNATPEYDVQTVCNSTISDFQFNGTAISFNASGENGTTGFCRICIPTTLINGTFTVSVNGTEVPYTLLPESTSTNSYLYFTYDHSTQEIIITPEFPSFLILSLFLIATLLTAIICKKRPTRTI